VVVAYCYSVAHLPELHQRPLGAWAFEVSACREALAVGGNYLGVVVLLLSSGEFRYHVDIPVLLQATIRDFDPQAWAVQQTLLSAYALSVPDVACDNVAHVWAFTCHWVYNASNLS